MYRFVTAGQQQAIHENPVPLKGGYRPVLQILSQQFALVLMHPSFSEIFFPQFLFKVHLPIFLYDMLTATVILVLVRLYSKHGPYVVKRKIQWEKVKTTCKHFFPELRHMLKEIQHKKKSAS